MTDDARGKLQFREFKLSEAETLAHWIASDTWPYHGKVNPDIDHVRKSIEDGFYTGDDNRTFWIFREEETDAAGIVFLHELTDLTPIFDIRLKADMRGQGLGRVIIKWLAEYVFTHLDKHRLEGHTRIDNIAMQKVFKACGWIKEGHYRQAWPDDAGNFHDAVAYAILKSDWETGITTPVNWQEPV